MGFLLYHDQKRSIEEYLINRYLREKLRRVGVRSCREAV
jgi:hypothetical protein